jgi:HAD superfamily hydrolase (TIGR01509 family)
MFMEPHTKIVSQKCILFDFDGVIADTESQYDQFWAAIGRDFQLGGDSFAADIKGTTISCIFNTYFPHASPEVRAGIADACRKFELQMDFRFVAGARAFINYLRMQGCKMAVVTSSPTAKMTVALRQLQLTGVFDAMITADDITRGKPDPMCYLRAAEKLQAAPADCVVFEDSIPGITAGKNAQMKVIGLSTTLPAARLHPLTAYVIPDFSDLKSVVSLL